LTAINSSIPPGWRLRRMAGRGRLSESQCPPTRRLSWPERS